MDCKKRKKAQRFKVSLGSIMLFIAAHRNKNKAALALKLESTPLANILPSRSGAIGLGIIFKF